MKSRDILYSTLVIGGALLGGNGLESYAQTSPGSQLTTLKQGETKKQAIERRVRDIYDNIKPRKDTRSKSLDLYDEKRAYEIAHYGGLGVDVSIDKLQNGNSEQKKVAMRSFSCSFSCYMMIFNVIPPYAAGGTLNI